MATGQGTKAQSLMIRPDVPALSFEVLSNNWYHMNKEKKIKDIPER